MGCLWLAFREADEEQVGRQWLPTLFSANPGPSGWHISFSLGNRAKSELPSPSAPAPRSRVSLDLLRPSPSKFHFSPLLSMNDVWSRRRIVPTTAPEHNAPVLAAENRQPRRIPSRLRRVSYQLTALLPLAIALTVTQEVLLWSYSPGTCDLGHARGCGWRLAAVLVPLAKTAIFTLLVAGLQFERLRMIVQHRKLLIKAAQEDQKPGSLGERLSRRTLPVDHWTIVASRDFFEKFAGMVARTQMIVYVIMGLYTSLATAAQLRSSVAWSRTTDGQRHLLQTCCPECQPFDDSCPCDSACVSANVGVETIMTLNFGIVVCLVTSLNFIPLGVWSPVADAVFKPSFETAAKVDVGVLKRTRALPIPVTVLVAAHVFCFAIYAGCHTASGATFRAPAQWYVVLISNLSVTAGALVAAVLCVGLWRLLALPFCLCRMLVLGLWAALARAVRPTAHIGSESSRSLHQLTYLWRAKSSWRYRHLILLLACLYAFATELGQIGQQLDMVCLLSTARILLILLLLANRDEAIQPESLLEDGAGFGLLVCATRLCKALRAHLDGRVYTGPMPRYKATALRMQETLALSYRWHDECAVDIGNGMSLNMTRWQVESILEAVKASGCLYVWIDKLAVPSTRNMRAVQKTLLARMISVYSAALTTLVLRSSEASGDRYHQRAWTLQEYCCGRNLIVYTQEGGGGEPRPASDAAKMEKALRGREDKLVELLRAEHQGRLARCVPVWLTEGGTTGVMQRVPSEDANRIWETYKGLAAKLKCTMHADMVRALYPLLWNRPAESHEELVRLLEALEEVHGIKQTALIGLLRQATMRAPRKSRTNAGEAADEDAGPPPGGADSVTLHIMADQAEGV